LRIRAGSIWWGIIAMIFSLFGKSISQNLC